MNNNYTSKQLYLRLLTYVKPYWAMFIVGVVSTILLAITQPAIAAMMKPLLDGVFVEKNETYIMWMPVILILLFFARATTSFISNITFAWIASKVVMNFRIRMFKQVLSLPTAHFDNNTVGSIISKFTNDVTHITASATVVLVTMIRDSVQVIGLIAWIVYIDWKLSLILFAFVPLVSIVIYFVGKRLRVMSLKLQESFGDLNHILSEGIRGQKEIKIFGGQDYENNRFENIANVVRQYQMKFQIASSISVPIVEILSAFIIAFIIYLSTHSSGKEAMSVGEFTSFFAALGLLLAPIKRLTKVNDPLQQSLAAAESVFRLIDTPAEHETHKTTNTLSHIKGQISFEKVTFKYKESESAVINQLSLEIKPQQTIALVGSSGSGKTTLANLLPRLYDLTDGNIQIDGNNIFDTSLTNLRSNIALVSQDITLFNDTITANIRYGSSLSTNKDADHDKVIAALEAANAHEFVNKLPEGLNTILGENGLRLSGGQRQRIAIARALYKNAPILILDEATSALDSESEKFVQNALENLKQHRTTIIIAHRLSTIENADRIIVMNAGKISESGTHIELLKLNGEYAKLYAIQNKH